jgi:integrase
MASISKQANGRKTIQFVGRDKKRRSIRLGKVSQRIAEKAKNHIEELVNCISTGLAKSPELTMWLDGLDDELHGRLEKAEIVMPRSKSTLDDFLRDCILKRNDVKPATKEVWGQVVNDLTSFFGEGCDVRSLNPGTAEDFKQSLIGRGLAATTVSKRLQFSRQFFRMAIKRGLIRENPFADCRHKATINLEERHYVTLEATQQLIDAADPDWQLIVALVRHAGLRCPSEVLSLEWRNVDWELGRMVVSSPKGERHGKPTRKVPLFKELRPYLEAAWAAAPDGAVYVLPERYRNAANKATGWRNCNLRTQFERIIERAGLEKWPRLFHAMRSSCESDLVKRHPLHIAARWLGNTPRIAEKHYLITSDSDFDEAAGIETGAPDKSGAECGADGENTAPLYQKAVQLPVQHDPAADRIKQNPAGTYAKPCGVTRADSDSQGGESGIRTRGQV